ncbi:hypothetical protein CBR_g55387 [Chara braunii]|uniref:Uncharacterized protein n=1 Tax=Chara braunii TaxID=69332 RepID=A0A388K7X9_CHABU|nr:hypothetical protein CBR_g55387 [Chara braunii]|eukprot:GBG66043.1 hypothetical protein CBR_g55387 [Chara braunii]
MDELSSFGFFLLSQESVVQVLPGLLCHHSYCVRYRPLGLQIAKVKIAHKRNIAASDTRVKHQATHPKPLNRTTPKTTARNAARQPCSEVQDNTSEARALQGTTRRADQQLGSRGAEHKAPATRQLNYMAHKRQTRKVRLADEQHGSEAAKRKATPATRPHHTANVTICRESHAKQAGQAAGQRRSADQDVHTSNTEQSSTSPTHITAFAVTSVVAPSDAVLAVAVPGIVPLALSPPHACAVVASVVAPAGHDHLVAVVVVTADVAAVVAPPVDVPTFVASGVGPLAPDRPPEYAVVASVDAPPGYLCFVVVVVVVVVVVAAVVESVVAAVGIAPQSHALPPAYVVVEVSPDMAPSSLALSPLCVVVVASTAALANSALLELENTAAASGGVVTAVAGETTVDEQFRLPRHVRAPATKPAPDHVVAVYGWQKYLVLPLAGGRDGLQVLERMLICRFSSTLNMVGRSAGAKRKVRPGRRERQKMGAPLATYRRGLLTFWQAGQGRQYVSLAQLLEDTWAAGVKVVGLVSFGEEVWGEKWSVIKRKFGTSTVVVDEEKLPLRGAKRVIERGGKFGVAPVVKTESARSRGKGYLRLLLEMPRKQAELKLFDITKLVFLYRCAREFKTKTMRRTLKEKIAAVIKKKTRVNIRLKVSVGVKVRVVLEKNKTVEQALTNHLESVRVETGLCTCSKDQLPRVEGHVLMRNAQCPLAPTFMHNGKNILQSDVGVKPMEVQRAVGRSMGRSTRAVMRRDLYQVADADCFQEIISDRIEARPACLEERARELAVRLNHLVVVPVDRNPDDLVIMCPATYHHGLQMMFNLNVAYHQVSGQSEGEVLALLRTEFKKVGLDKLGAWNPATKLGRAYVLPKHKDLTRWRPIAPTI